MHSLGGEYFVKGYDGVFIFNLLSNFLFYISYFNKSNTNPKFETILSTEVNTIWCKRLYYFLRKSSTFINFLFYFFFNKVLNDFLKSSVLCALVYRFLTYSVTWFHEIINRSAEYAISANIVGLISYRCLQR